MKKDEKKEKSTPLNCVCGAAAINVKSRNRHMITCPDPMNCEANLRTTWEKNLDLAIAKWNNLIYSARSARRH